MGKQNGRNVSARNKLPIALIEFTYKRIITHWSPGIGDSKTFHAPYDWGNDLPMRTMEMFDYNWSTALARIVQAYMQLHCWPKNTRVFSPRHAFPKQIKPKLPELCQLVSSRLSLPLFVRHGFTLFSSLRLFFCTPCGAGCSLKALRHPVHSATPGVDSWWNPTHADCCTPSGQKLYIFQKSCGIFLSRIKNGFLFLCTSVSLHAD